MKNKLSFTIFVYFFILVFLSLGIWQCLRLNWKLNLIDQINSSLNKDPVFFTGSNEANFLTVKFEGTIDYDKQIYLYSLNDDGAPGFDLINPIKIENKNFLINRGWIPLDKKNFKFKVEDNNFTGILREISKYSYFKPKNDINKNYWFTLNSQDLKDFTGVVFSPYIIYQTGDKNLNILPEQKNITSNISNNHLKYALTWFSLAISIFLIYLYFRKKNY